MFLFLKKKKFLESDGDENLLTNRQRTSNNNHNNSNRNNDRQNQVHNGYNQRDSQTIGFAQLLQRDRLDRNLWGNHQFYTKARCDKLK